MSRNRLSLRKRQAESNNAVGNISLNNPDPYARLKDLLVLAKLFEQNQTVDVSAADITALDSLLKNKEALNVTPEELQSLENLQQAKGNGTASNTEENVNVKGVEGESSEIQKLLEGGATETPATGLVDETQSRQSGLRLNLIIFILFLLAVIAWIFWVNRELIKERRAMTESDADKKPDSEKENNKKIES